MRLFAIVLATLIALPAAAQSDCDFGTLHPEAPPETAQFGFLVGQWDIEGRAMQQDGTWTPGFRPAYWEGRYILGGYAIADYWYDAPLEADGPAPGRGVNIRMYDPEAGHWQIMWQHTNRLPVQAIQAEWLDDKMRLWFLNADSTRATDRRLTFFDISENAWTWTREVSQDEGETWNPIVKLSATRRDCAQ